MSSLSAPRWSIEDETRETLSLTDQEREKVYSDVFGRCHHPSRSGRSCSCVMSSQFSSPAFLSDTSRKCSIRQQNDSASPNSVCRDNDSNNHQQCSAVTINRNETTTAIESVIRLIQDAIECLSDNNVKGPYCDGMRINPSLTVKETQYHAFLQRENGNYHLAANRICSYWSLRKRIFKDRAYNPMTMKEREDYCNDVVPSDATALDSNDMELLNSGALKLLPPDDRGRKVLFFDKSVHKHAKQFPRDCLLRCMFYLLHTATLTDANDDVANMKDVVKQRWEPIQPTTDMVLLCNFMDYDVKQFDRKCFKVQMEMLNFCIPSRIVAVHYCYGGKRSAFDLVLPTIKLLMGSSLRQRLCLHTETSCCKGIAGCLKEDYGIHHIPESLGGGCGEDNDGIVVPQLPPQYPAVPCDNNDCDDDGGDDMEWKKTTNNTTVTRQPILSNGIVCASSSTYNHDGERRSLWNSAA